MVIRHVCIITN